MPFLSLLLCAAADRDFPKTLIFDEPGIDDEISFPTFSILPRGAAPGREIDLAFELDKRLTTWLSLQLNIGHTTQPQPGRIAYGWQNASATMKAMILADSAAEQLVSISLGREFGGTGAARIGAAQAGATTAALNFGQGAGSWTPLPWLKPFAVTGTLGYVVPDTNAVPRQALLGASLQYSLAALDGAPPSLRPLIPIIECTETLPSRIRPTATLAPGLIYAGEGYQLAAELLVPLTRTAGSHLGAIAQLNLSLSRLGLPALAEPVFK